MTHPTEFRKPGERNFIRVGDLVKCSPVTRERSFVGKVVRLDADRYGVVHTVNVAMPYTCGGARHPDAGKARAFTWDRVTRTQLAPETVDG